MKIANFDFSKKCHQIAKVTEGLSGREISKIAIAWQVRLKNSENTNINMSKVVRIEIVPRVHGKGLRS